MRIQNAFDKALDHFRIKPQQICKVSGVSSSQMSQWRNNKKDVSTRVLGQMLEAMEKIEPKALEAFGNYLCGKQPGDRKLSNKVLAEELSKLADALRDVDVEEAKEAHEEYTNKEKVAA